MVQRQLGELVGGGMGGQQPDPPGCRRQAGLGHGQQLCKPQPGWAAVQTASHHGSGFFLLLLLGIARFSKLGIQVTEGFRYFHRFTKKGKPAASRVPIAATSQSIKDDLEIAISKTVKLVHFF